MHTATAASAQMPRADLKVGPCQGLVVSFQLAEPLDWFQLRALLWEGVEAGLDWDEVAAFLAERCPRSAPVDGATCRRVYERIVGAFAEADAGQPDTATPDVAPPDAAPPHAGLPDAAPPSGPALWTKLLYSSVHGLFPQTPVFMNLGYVGEVAGLELAPEDQPLYPFIALYRRALDGVAIAGRDVVDVGCGTGGGCWHLLRYLEPRSVTGIDLVDANIAAATQLFRDSRLRFMRADAGRLPLPDASADVVVSVESSHCYESFAAFLGEVHRVLRPGGTFAFADHRPLAAEWGDGRTLDGLERDLAGSSLDIVQRSDITPQVVASCDLLAGFKEQMLRDAPLSDVDRTHLREILHCSDSENHSRMSGGAWRYSCFTIRKPA